jgi:rhodanese-related sulfurtransferase
VIPQLTAREVAARREAGEEFQILDVREESELALASLPDVVWLPMSELSLRLSELDPDERWVVLCHHGIRSNRVAGILLGQGFSDVSNLRGGIDAWSREVDAKVPVY